MRRLLSLLFVLSIGCPALAQVAGAEYFIDTDPGYGAATFIAVTAGNDVTQEFTLALSSVTEGFHAVGVRARDAQGRWSITYLHTFYVVPGAAATVAGLEYFIDTDPGYGNATAIPAPVSADSSLHYVVPLSAHAGGFHTIGIRSKDALGKWSQTSLHVFYNDVTTAPVNIVRLEYSFTGNGSNQQIYTYPVSTPAPTVDLNFTASLDSLVGDREYDMHIWAVNSEGARSEVLVRKIKVCSGEPAKARFDFIPLGTQISFVDSSRGGAKYKWDFGDGKIDSVSNPVHSYFGGGNYAVKLIVSNFCNNDTAIRSISVLSLQNIFPSAGGNTGNVTVTITGKGFNDSTKVKLLKGGIEIRGVDNRTNGDGRFLYTTFDLSNHPIGNWSLMVFNAGDSLTLNNAFSIEEGVTPVIKIDIVGRTTFRAGRAEKFTVKYTNLGNVDTYLVPISLLYPKTVQVQLMNELIRLSGRYNLSVFNEDSLPVTINKGDSTLLALVVPHIPAKSSGDIEILLTAPSIAHLPFTVIVNRPIYDSFGINSLRMQGRSSENRGLSACWATHLGAGLVIAGGGLSILSLAEVSLCGIPITASIAGMGVSITDLVRNDEERQRSNNKTGALISVASFTASALGALASIAGCGAVGTQATVTAGVGLGLAGVGAIISGFDYYYNPGCRADVKSYVSTFMSLASYDPNEKTGPKGNTVYNYQQGLAPFNYKIYFENQNTATAPAQEVIILDTLDKAKLDLSTFQLQSYGFGDSVNVSIPSGLSFYATNNLLKRLGKSDLLVRVDAKLDTATGLLKWRFLSLDPQTREFIADPLDGFLPPNVTSPQGEGYVSYSVISKADLLHGTQIRNKATIYFDNNPPITTNEFLNTIDKVKPSSSVVSVPAEVYDTTFAVQWSGTDEGAGIRSYDIYYKVNNGPYQLWQYDVSLPENNFTGQKDSTYSFFSISKDYAGNVETSKTGAERVVTIKIFDSSNKVCAGVSTAFSATPAGAGFIYQWQVNEGNGFADIANNVVYSGANTSQLTLTTPPTVYSNYKYRCKLSNGTVTYYSSLHAVRFVATWVGTANDAWETPANWSCGSVPDENTDVIIDRNALINPVLNATTSCKSLTLNQDANIIVRTGAKLIITGKL